MVDGLVEGSVACRLRVLWRADHPASSLGCWRRFSHATVRYAELRSETECSIVGVGGIARGDDKSTVDFFVCYSSLH